MKPPFTYRPLTHFCECENGHLLEYGKHCNICKGKIGPTENTLEERLPETRFDETYFEELEAYYYNNDEEFAA